MMFDEPEPFDRATTRRKRDMHALRSVVLAQKRAAGAALGGAK
jgi:hypothetical protein